MPVANPNLNTILGGTHMVERENLQVVLTKEVHTHTHTCARTHTKCNLKNCFRQAYCTFLKLPALETQRQKDLYIHNQPGLQK